jgi:hypothetical protein
MQLLKMIRYSWLCQVRWLRIRCCAVLLVCPIVGGWALPWRHQISHEGFSVLVRSDWVDSSDKNQVINVWSKWGGLHVLVEKMPGDSESELELHRRLLAKTRTEEPLTEWFQFKGHGFRFRTFDRNGEIQEEDVLFFPEGAFAGFYIKASNRSAQSNARSQYEQVIKSLHRIDPTKGGNP